MSKIGSVVVTFQPNEADLLLLLNSVYTQVNELIIINNGDCIDDIVTSFSICTNSNIIYQHLGENVGIAKAQNLGVQIASELGCVYTLLLDQDSVLPDRMVDGLLEGFSDAAALINNIAAVGPKVIDKRSRKVFPFYSYYKYKRKISGTIGWNKDFIETDHLISSGTIVNNSVFNDNPNLADLFIEYVDIEWCMRVRGKGYKILHSKTIEMEHMLGDNRVTKFGIEFPVHKPMRYYYVYRNGGFCILRTRFPLGWKLYNIFRLVSLGALLLLVSDERVEIIKSIYRGIFDINGVEHKK